MRLLDATGDAPPVQLTPQTRFQQNYRIAAAVNAGSDVVAIANGKGDVELFTVGTDDTVWNFHPDPSSSTGYTGVSTGLQAGTISAGVDAGGNIVVFTTINLQLWYSVETPGRPTRWSEPAQVDVPAPPNPVAISAVRTAQIGGQLYVAVLTQVPNAMGPTYNLAWSRWDSGQPVFQCTDVSFSSLHCVWLGHDAQSAAFACVDQIIAAYGIASGDVTRYPMATTFRSISVDAAPDNTGNDRIVAVLADGNAYRLVGGANHQPYSWAQLSIGMTLRQIVADVDDQGDVPLFAVSGDNRVYHWQPMAASRTGYSDPPAPIASDTALIAVAKNDGTAVDVFAAGTAHNTLSHLFQGKASTLWNVQALEVPSNGHVQEYISYTTDVVFADAAGAPLPNLPVTVTASEKTRATINGATYYLDAHRPVRLSTNNAAMLSIAQETGSLSVADLQVFVPSLMTPGSSIALAQSAVTQARLKRVTGKELREDARDAAGNYLLPDQYRTETTTNSMAAAFQNLMSLPATFAAHPALLGRHAQEDHGVWYRRSGSAAELPYRIAPEVEQHWQLSFDGCDVRYRALSGDEASALVAFKRASLPDAAGPFDWLESIGDFVRGVADGIIQVVDTIVTTVGNAVQAVITFIADGVQAVFTTIVRTVETAFAVVETIFARVKVFFEKVFEWLGFLFDWPDMLRTHDAFAYAIDQLFGFMQGAAGGMQRIIDDGITNVQAQLAALFNKAVRDIAGSASIGGFEKANAQTAPEFSAATANTVIGNAIVDNAAAATVSASLLDAIHNGPIADYIAELVRFAEQSEAGQAFADASRYFQNLGGSPDQIFSQLLAGMMQVVHGMLQAVLSGVKLVIDGLFQLIQGLIAAIRALLNEAWNIPFLSDFYSWITRGAKLTTIDLIALLVAVPSTIVYKIAHDAAPFPDDASVNAFKSSFSAQTMLQKSGLGGRTAPCEERSAPGDGPGPWAALLKTGAAVSTFFYGSISAIIDGLQLAAPPFLSKVALILESMAQVMSCPWLTGTAKPDCSTGEGTAATLWIYTCFGCLLDAAFVATEGRIPENWTDGGVVVAFLYGCGQLIVSIIACIPEDTTKVEVAAMIVSCVPPLAKLALLKSIIAATEGISLIVVAAVDKLFYTAAAILGVAAGKVSDACAEPLLVTA